MRTTVALAILTQVAFSQEYPIPFASSGNILELSVANTSTASTTGVRVKVTNLPGWLHFSPSELSLQELKAGEEAAAAFTFSVDKSAPVSTPQTLTFVITNSRGESWTKDINISIQPPEKYELFQNYPNPFNPSTAISYQLSADSRVSFRIYDILGREVATLVDQDVPAGYHKETWNATTYSSGMYIYQLTYTDPQGNRQFHRKTMLLVK